MRRLWDHLFPQEFAFSGAGKIEGGVQSVHTLIALQGAEGVFYIYLFGSALCRAQLPLLSAQL